jgi:hypothetical protein
MFDIRVVMLQKNQFRLREYPQTFPGGAPVEQASPRERTTIRVNAICSDGEQESTWITYPRSRSNIRCGLAAFGVRVNR